MNHSLHFVDPETGAHTNRIESSWRHAKESFSSHGRVKYHVPGNLARYMFVKAARFQKKDPTDEFIAMAASVYPGTEDRDQVEEEQDSEEVEMFDEE